MDLKQRIKIALGLNEEPQEVKLMFEAKLVDGTIVVSEADELAEGVVVNILSEDGVQTPMPEGTYTLEDGTEFSTDANGLVTAVAAKEEEVEEEVEAEDKEEEVEMSDINLEEVGKVVRELLQDVSNEIKDIKAELDELRGENLSKDENIVDLQNENVELSKQVKELNEAPSAEPVLNTKFGEVKKANKVVSNDDYRKMTKTERFYYNLTK